MVIRGDARNLPVSSGSVQCCVTSPPYWGLRDYGVPSQLGLEATPDAYVASMVAVFREVWRVLRDDGTLWLNLGSSYNGAGYSNNLNTGGATREQGGKQKHSYVSRGRTPIQLPDDAPACGSDGTGLPDSTGADSACSGLCDGCLADWLSHRDRIAGTGRPTGQSGPLPSQTSRGSVPSDSASASLGASLLDAQASSTLESWLQRRGACSRCDSRASALLGLRSSSADAQAFAGMTWLDYTTRLKQKDMVPIPWMVAMALQADGWYLRSDIIWSKNNPMPESVTDRPTKSHEYLFLLTKIQRYYYDAGAIAESANPQNYRANASMREVAPGSTRQGKLDARRGEVSCDTRNRRSVWTVNTQPYRDAHFAVMPEKLVEPCILAGSKPGDLVLDPFAGSGTVGVVARRYARRFIGCDLNPAYIGMAGRRLAQTQPGLALEASA